MIAALCSGRAALAIPGGWRRQAAVFALRGYLSVWIVPFGFTKARTTARIAANLVEAALPQHWLPVHRPSNPRLGAA